MLVCTSTFYRAWLPASPPFCRASTCHSLTCRKVFGRKSSWRLLISIKIIYNHMAIISRPLPWHWLSSQCCSHCRWAGSRPPCPASLSASTWRCQNEDFFLSHLLKGERYWCELSGQTEKAGVFSEKVSRVPANFFFSWIYFLKFLS